MNNPCHESDSEIDRALGQDWPAKGISPTEATMIARLPMDRMNARGCLNRIPIMLDTVVRDLDKLRQIGTIDAEAHHLGTESVRAIAMMVAAIPKRDRT